MNYPSIEIQGSVIAASLLGRLRHDETLRFQRGRDFYPGYTDARLKDEISFVWQEAKGHWMVFQSRLKRLGEGASTVTETRNLWIVPLLRSLGYDLVFERSAETLGGKSFPISHRDQGRDAFPVLITGFTESLDKKPENRTYRVSPHALVQEYLNYSDHLYGIVTNGRQLRLLRDANRITRLSYAEFNLEKMMEEDLYADFVVMYRLLHATRMPAQKTLGAESIIEGYHQEGLEAGSTIRSKLGIAVKDVILQMAEGFLNHPENTGLRGRIADASLSPDTYFRLMLRVIYRFLFLFTIEERNLIFGESRLADTKRFSRIYDQWYSLMRLRKLARKLPPPDAARHTDLWAGVLNTFALFEKAETGKKMGIMALEGDLFGYDALCDGKADLHTCRLDNRLLLGVIRALTYFENDQGVLTAVNYGGLDVEEFGSVYEGLLELNLTVERYPAEDRYLCAYQSSTARSQSGSHYTPEELVQPLIQHSLDHLIRRRVTTPDAYLPAQDHNLPQNEKCAAALLTLRVCDISCGSGHILLSAARRIALEVARQTTGEEQPNPAAVRRGMKEVIRRCIYGVDKNDLAVELCKTALWLESYNPGEPLTFLDHRIRCGDSIIGVARQEELASGIPEEAFKKLPGDDSDLITTLKKRHRAELGGQGDVFDSGELDTGLEELSGRFNTVAAMPEWTPEEVRLKAAAYQAALGGSEWKRLKEMADLRTAQFFLPKTPATELKLATHGDYLASANRLPGRSAQKIAAAEGLSAQKRFFHWFLEYPEVFATGGFDCIIGNPPFLGGQKLSGTFGDNFLHWVKTAYAPAGSCDLVTYFFRRAYTLLKPRGFQALISTNTIAQGAAREGGLEVMVNQGASINFAVKSMRWPGMAAVEVALVALHKGDWKHSRYLDGRKVEYINPYLDDAQSIGNPFQLRQNENKSFQGSIVLGKGFVLTPEDAAELIRKNPKNKDVLFPYLNGEDLNSNYDQSPSRWVINFFDWEEEKCKREYPDCFEIVERLVKPERTKNNDKIAREKWWQFLRMRGELYKTIEEMRRAIAIPEVTKFTAFTFSETNKVFSHMLKIIAADCFSNFAIISTSIHEYWAWKYASTMGGSVIRYTPTAVFETFPFPQNLNPETEGKLEEIGERYYTHRQQLMLAVQLGLTKTYNLFHCKNLKEGLTAEEAATIKDKDLTHLLKHLAATPGLIPFHDVAERIITLRRLHREMDLAVLSAYGWDDIDPAHNFYEVDYLPENDRVRFTISPAARREILTRLLALNHHFHSQELSSGDWDKKKPKSTKSKTPPTPKAENDAQGRLF